MSRKAARVKGAVGITSSSRDPLAKLPVNKRNFVLARASGASVKASAAHAGVSNRQGSKYNTQAEIQAAYRYLVQKAIPASKLVNLIKGGCEAKMPVYGPDGKKISERADWKTRRPYIEMAATHGGYHEDKSSTAPLGIQVVVNHIGQRGNTERTAQVTTEANRTLAAL